MLRVQLQVESGILQYINTCFSLMKLYLKWIWKFSEDQQKFSRKNKNIYKKEFFRIEIFVLLGVTFFTYFNQTSLETIVIPFTEVMFGWSELENSILFCIGGLVIIASYIVIRALSTRLADRSIIFIGLLSIAIGLVIACACWFGGFILLFFFDF